MKYLLTILMASCFTCCSVKKQNTIITPRNPDSVTIVFINPPNQDKVDPGAGKFTVSGPSFLSYIGSNRLPKHIDQRDINDTITLPTINGYIEINHLYKGMQHDYFYLKGGDTVTFTYNELAQPIAHSSISDTLTRQYNFISTIEGGSLDYGYSPYYCLLIRNVMLHKKKMNEVLLQYSQYIDNYRNALQNAEASGILDSTYSDYYSLQFNFQEIQFKHWESMIKQRNFKLEREYNQDNNDEYTKLISYNNIISWYRDPDVALISVLNSSTTPPFTKNQILYKILMGWNISSPFQKGTAQLEEMYEKVIEKTGDSAVVKHLKEEFEYRYSVPANIKTGDLLLFDLSGNTTTMEDVITKHKGKVIYVDFWASWCAPCIQNMPAAHSFRKEYQGKDIIFINLSTRDQERAWKDAVVQHNTGAYGGEDYLILNPDKSDLIKTLKIDLIPRYIIIDKQGSIVDTNAPRPNQGDLLRAALNKYLKSK